MKAPAEWNTASRQDALEQAESRLAKADPEGWAQMTAAERADVLRAEAMPDKEYEASTMDRTEDNMREEEREAG
jgi:hypothetical protein